MKKHISRLTAVLFVLALSLNHVFAVPAYRGWQSMTQPDGTTITIRQMGDEFFHYWENEAGQQVAKDAEGFWRVVEKTAEQSAIQKRKQASRRYNQAEPDKPAKVGTINLAPRGLVILVNYSDVTFRTGNTKATMSDLMNSTNYTYDNATGSVREFFKAQSNGAYVPDFDVVGPYTLQNNRAHYGGNDSGGDDLLAGNMIVEACKAADADGVDFTLYNNDGDTYVDFVYVIYAGVGEADSDVEDAVWPHNWTLSSARYYNNCSYTKSQSMVDGLYIENYACSGELRGGTTTRCAIGTIAHEFGHVLGLPDYYVTDKNASNYGKKYTPGSWHIMDYGSYNNDGRTPPNYTPHDKYFFGWSTPTLLAKDEKKNCTLTTTYGSAYQITGGTTLKGATASDRIWYLENRQKSGWDKYLPGHGMVVWEVTYNLSNWNSNVPNNSTVGYTIVTANNLTRPYTPYTTNDPSTGNCSTPFPGTSNVKSWTPATGCALTEITESAGNITFKYNGGVNKTTCTYEFVTDHCTAPADGSVAINASLSVTITPNSGYSLADASCWTVEMGGIPLTYGTDFTYTPATNTFYIASLTDDVVILAEAKAVRTVTWSVNGSTTTIPASTFVDGAALVLPSNPADCSGEGGKKFVGWTAQSSVSGSAPADLFNSVGSKTVTANTTYYAVYAAASGSGSGTPSSATYTFSNKSWNASPSNWTSGKDGAGFINNGVQVTTGATGANATCPTPYSDISSIVVSYCTNGNSGAGSITMAIGSITLAESVTKMGGTTARDLTFDFSSSTPSGSPKITVTCTTNSIYVCGLTINYGGGGGTSYSDYSLTCGAPVVCALTGITLNTSGATTTFTTGDTFSSAGLVVTAHYSNCADATVTPTSISSPDMSTAGTKTITVSYTENETTETETYTITVSDPATHTVTWSVQGNTSTTTFADGASLVVPSPQPSDCSGTDGKIFVGWTAHSTVDGSEPDDLFLVPGTKTVTADITYYAVYADYDVTSGGGAFDGDTEGSYKIYAEVSGTKYYATGTVSSGKMSGTTNEADAPEYTFTKVSGGWTIQNGTTYITYSGSTNLGTSSSAYTWTISEGSHGSWRVASGTSGRAWIYRAGSVNKFGGYSTVNVNGTEYFDLEIGGGSSSVITYSDYSLTCTDTPPVPTYTVTYMACGAEFTTQTYSEGDPLVLPNPAPEDNAGKSFVGWTATEHYTGAEAPTLISAGSTVNADATYYAVFH